MAAPADPAGSFLRDEARLHQHLDVPGDRLQRDRERFGQLGDEKILAVEPFQNGAADRIGESREHAIENRRLGLCWG